MKMQLIAVGLVLAAGPAAAQTSDNWQKVYGQQPAPQAPRAPATAPSQPAFKPYQGTSPYSPRGGINAYPAPARPRSGATNLFGPDGKPKR